VASFNLAHPVDWKRVKS